MAQNDLLAKYPGQAGRFIELFNKTDKERPRGEDILALRRLLVETPQLWEYAGDLAAQVVYRIIESAEGTPALQESLRTGYVELQRELGAEESTALERMLIQQVVVAWMRLYIIEYKYTVITRKATPIRVADYWERRLSAAQQRFLRAGATLTRIRKLALPPFPSALLGGRQMN